MLVWSSYPVFPCAQQVVLRAHFHCWQGIVCSWPHHHTLTHRDTDTKRLCGGYVAKSPRKGCRRKRHVPHLLGSIHVEYPSA